MLAAEKTVIPKVNSESTKHECIHCHRTFPGGAQSVRVHLQHCPARMLTRFFHVDKYLIALISNPLRRKIMGLDTICQKFPDDVRVIISALKYLEATGELKTFHVLECEKSPVYLELPPGRVARQMLWKTLSTEDMTALRSMVDMVS